MKHTLRLWYGRQITRFLGRFAEVRGLRALEANHKQAMLDLYAEQRALKADASSAKAALEEQSAALEIITDARLNSDRLNEFLRGELEMVRQQHDAAMNALKAQVDWYALEMRGREVHGQGRPVMRNVAVADEPAPSRMTGRQAVKQSIEYFMDEALKRGQQPPAQPEYSSAQ